MASVTTPQRTYRRRERTRNELVSAAERLVAARGMDALSIEEITAAADVAKGTFYTHFTDKEDLAAAIGLQIRLELEGKISSLNRSVKDAPQRMANGLSTVLLYAIEQPIRARALMRLIPGSVNPDTPINAGIRADIQLGLKTKVFWAASVNAAVVITLGAAMSAAMRLSDRVHAVSNPFDFAADVVATVLVALGVEPNDAVRTARDAMAARREKAPS